MELNYKEFGAGDPIVILHGLFGTLDNWQTIAKQLAEEHLVYIVDQRNHGKSPHTEAFSYALMAEDLLEFLADKGIFRTHIIGHSMGGKTAMQFALEHPDYVDKLVVVDIGPYQYPGGHQQIFDALFSVDLEQLSSRKEIQEKLAEKIEGQSVLLFLMKNLTRLPEGGYRWKMNLKSLYENYQAILSALPEEELFDGETLFIRGAQSNYIPEDGEAALKAWFPDSKLISIPNAGHWVHAEAPQPFLTTLKAYLND
ncbi:MAG: alpha/beta fold hydrolase [Bacteroidota bacterium]